MFSLVTLRLRAAARKAARVRDWVAAGNAYRTYLDRRPQDSKSWVQYGHVAKEAGDLETAVSAYGRALDIEPTAAEIWWHLSHACKRLGDRSAAIDCCAHAAALDPRFTNAIDGLVDLGARDRIPLSAACGPAANFNVENQETEHRSGAEPPAGSAVFAPSRYDAYRQELAIAAPPIGHSIAKSMTILVDARGSFPADVRMTLSSLLDQVDVRWEAIVLAPTSILDHSVASLAAIDPRVRFVALDASLPNAETAPHVLLVAAGTMLDRQTVAWFSYTVATTGCVAAYCDHDECTDDWQAGRRFMRPVFQSMFDPCWRHAPRDYPAALLIDNTRLPLAHWWQHDAHVDLHEAARIGSIAHIPLLLASRRMLAAQAEQAPPDPVGMFPPRSPRATTDTPDTVAGEERIQVVIQTRDEPTMLRAAIDSIRRQASRKDLLDITVVDNRSVEVATSTLLDRLRRSNIATVIPLDEPFNWSRANNVAVDQGTASLLLFLNNDTEMLSANWDDALRQALAANETGVVGATLLYPDRSIQHAGIVMGMGNGGPIHEGVGRSIEAGPNDRWRKRRSASAVTGAFLAMRRDVFSTIGGFDAVNFAIAFNDIDICLRCREAGFRVVMASDILVIHHESKTRGMNVTRSQIAWDLDELGRLYDRWGPALFVDPAYNPHWTRVGHPFDGYRYPSLQEILRHISISGRKAPWAPIARLEVHSLVVISLQRVLFQGLRSNSGALQFVIWRAVMNGAKSWLMIPNSLAG